MIKKILLFGVAISQLLFGTLTIENNQVKDLNGNTIPLKSYKKIVVADPAVVETFYMIGSEKNIVAISTSAKTKIFPYDKTSSLESVGNVAKLNLEKIVSYAPDLVILNPMSTNILPNLNRLNIPVIVNNPTNIEEILSNVLIYGELTGNSKNAKVLYDELTTKLHNLKTELKNNPLNLSGVILYSTSPMMAFNKTSLPGQIFNLLGVKNIADFTVGNKPILSAEYLLQSNPDFIAGAMNITTKDIINSNPIVSKTTAGKNNNLFILDSQQILRSSPRIIYSIEDLYSYLKNLKVSQN